MTYSRKMEITWSTRELKIICLLSHPTLSQTAFIHIGRNMPSTSSSNGTRLWAMLLNLWNDFLCTLLPWDGRQTNYTSRTQSELIGPGLYVYQICQQLHNSLLLQALWRAFLEQFKAKVNICSCPMAARVSEGEDIIDQKEILGRTLWATLCHSLLQTASWLSGDLSTGSNWMLSLQQYHKSLPLHLMLLYFFSSGIAIMAATVCIASGHS